MWDGHIGLVSVAKNRIKLLDGNIQPVFSASYKAGPWMKELEKIEIERMLKDDITEPPQTEWAAPAVLASQKNRFFRVFVGYRQPIAVTKRN